MNIKLNVLFPTIRQRVVVVFASLLVIFTGCSEYERWRNGPPTIHTFTVPKEVHYGETVELRVNVSDPEEDALTYAWDASDGILDVEDSSEIQWTAPELPKTGIAPDQKVIIYVSVRDDNEETVSESATITVYSKSYRVAEALSGDYELIRTQVAAENVEDGGTMRLTTTIFTRELKNNDVFLFGSYKLIEPFDERQGTIHWFSNNVLEPDVSSYTWDGALLVLFWNATGTGHIYQKHY